VFHNATIQQKNLVGNDVIVVQSPYLIDMEAPQEQKQDFFKEILKASLIALIIVVPIRFFVAQPYIVAGASMYTTFADGHYIIVDQLTYRFNDPQRGDVIIFKYPNDPSKFFIKRILGLPGETIVLRDGELLITNSSTSTEGYVLPQPFVDDNRQKTDEFIKKVLEDDEYFVMGDNRSASSDSRTWGPLQEDYIIGRAILRVLPVGGFGLFPGDYTYSNLEFEN